MQLNSWVQKRTTLRLLLPGQQFPPFKCCKLHVEFSCQQDRLQPHIFWFFSKKSNCDEWRGWKGVFKVLGANQRKVWERLVYPFPSGSRLYFFSSTVFGSGKGVLLQGSGVSSLRWVCGERSGRWGGAAWCIFLNTSSALSPSRPELLSLVCSAWPFPTAPSCPWPLLHQPSVHLSRLITSRIPHPLPGLHPSSGPSVLHIGMTLRISLGPRFSQLGRPVLALAPSGLAALTCAKPVSEAQSCGTSSPVACNW